MRIGAGALFRQSIAAVLAACLVLSTPGLPAYQAFAAGVKTKGGSAAPSQAPAGPVSPLAGAFDAPLNPASLSVPGDHRPAVSIPASNLALNLPFSAAPGARAAVPEGALGQLRGAASGVQAPQPKASESVLQDFGAQAFDGARQAAPAAPGSDLSRAGRWLRQALTADLRRPVPAMPAIPAVAAPLAAPLPAPSAVRGWHKATAAVFVVGAAYAGFTVFSWPGLGVAATIAKFVVDKTFARMRANETPAAAAVAPPAEPAKPAEPAAPEAAPAAAAAAKSPTSLAKLPAEAREWSAERILEAKQAAQARAREIAPDAQLVGAAIGLDDPRSHWNFTFYSKAQNKALTVYPKRLDAKPWPQGRKAVPLRDSRLTRLDSLEKAYAALKRQKHWFAPARVEVVPAWKGDAHYRFTDDRGREHFVAGTAQAVVPDDAPISADGVAGEVRSFDGLPADAKISLSQFMEAKAAAQSRERAAVPDAQLIGAAIDLSDPRARWRFAFESRSRKRKGAHPPLWDSRLQSAPLFKTAYTALKRAKPWFKPARAELQPGWKGDPVWVFTDASGRRFVVNGRAPPAEAPPPAPSPPDPAAAPPPGPPTPAAQPPQAKKSPHISEDLFGFRWLKGLTHHAASQPALKRLSADAGTAEIIDHLTGQFPITRARVLELGKSAGLDEDSPRKGWLVVYDNLKARNKAARDRFDHKKHEGSLAGEALGRIWAKARGRPFTGGASFRALPDAKYPEGWTGLFKRAAQVQKHAVGFYLRLPYHLFDMFVLGYYRKSFSYEFLHSTEDYLSLIGPDIAEKNLAAAFNEYAAPPSGLMGRAKRPFSMARDAFMATTWGRRVNRYVLVPAVSPTLTFLKRRVTLAVLSAVAMGAIGALAPGLPFFGFSLTAIPGLGEALVAVGKGAPIVVGAVPFVGDFLAPVVGAAMNALLRDLVIGPMLNTLMLTTMLTFPRAVRERLLKLREMDPERRLRLLSAETAAATLRAAFSWAFWSANWKSFIGMITVGAEIEGIMTYAGGIDGFVSDKTGAEFTLFHDLGSAVEKPEGESVIPFGGAITWGNVLLYKAQEWMGFNISDSVMQWLNPKLKGRSAQEVFELASADAKVAALEKARNPLTPDERAEYDRLLAELEPRRDEDYVEAKLTEIHDLKNPQDGLARLKSLRELQAYYDDRLVEAGPDAPGVKDDLSTREAGLQALSRRLTAATNDSEWPGDDGAPRVDEPTVARIAGLVQKIEELRTLARAEMTQRDADQQLLAVAAKARNETVRARSPGKEMQEINRSLSRLDSFMNVELSLNEVNAAQKAITDMMGLLDEKIGKVDRASRQNEGDLAGADARRAEVETWKAEVDAEIEDDKATKARILSNEVRARSAVERFTEFQAEISKLIADINAADGGESGSALAEYQHRLGLLPSVVEWRTNGDNPNDPDAFSLKKFEDNRDEIDDYITKINDGLARLRDVDPDTAGPLVIIIPGPRVDVHNPSIAQARQILADRKVYWEDRRAQFQKSLDSIDRRMDPSNALLIADEFGDRNPESLPLWQAQQTVEIARAQKAVREFAARIDAAAAQVNAAADPDLPPLSGLSLAQLREAIKTYGDRVREVELPEGDTDEGHAASLNLVLIAQLVPALANDVVHWAKADAIVTAIGDAMKDTLPPAKTGLTEIVGMIDDVLADVALDQAFIETGAGGGQTLIDRKTALLRDKLLPPLQRARVLIEKTLIPFQEDSIAQAQKDTGDLWKLFDAQKTLITGTVELHDETLPWALAAFGGEKGNAADSHAEIRVWRDKVQRNIDGYDDAQGHHKGVKEYQAEAANRKSPDFTGPETEGYLKDPADPTGGPYSLPRKIARYSEERELRARQLNAQGVEINKILTDIEALSDKHNLRTLRLPTDVTPDADGAARVQRLVDEGFFTDLVDKLKEIGDEAQASAGDLSIGGDDEEGVPTGTQPPITLEDSQQIALLALEAGKRLVPSSREQPESAPAGYAVLRLLYSDTAVEAAQEALAPGGQVAVAEDFLQHAFDALSAAVASTEKDHAYVDSNGASETPQQVYARKIATFGALQAFLQEGAAFFDLKKQWSQDTLESIGKLDTYYESLHDIHDGGVTVGASELEAAQKIKDALTRTYDDLEATRLKLRSWRAQLSDPHESALRRVNAAVSDLQVKTRAVLHANIDYHGAEERSRRSRDILKARLSMVDDAQQELLTLLNDPLLSDGIQDGLPAELVNRIEGLRLSRAAWAMGPPGGADAVVIKKAEFPAFLDTVLKMFQNQRSAQDLSRLKQDLLADPRGLAALIPDSQMLDFDNAADGFYLVYQSRFAVPKGLETGSWVTLGNIAKVWGNDISVTGYQYATPPNDLSAPSGNKGLGVQVQRLESDRSVHYINVDFHRFAFDIPPDGSVEAQARESRMMIFDDFAVMLFGDKLYIGMAGFGDFALDHPEDHPYYYGGNLKTSLKLTEVMRLDAEQQVAFAKDPRDFFQRVNLDFTGYDPDLNRNIDILAAGQDKDYARTQVGPKFDVGRALGQRDSFTVDMFWSKTGGTDDYNQQALGATILKGFTLRDDSGKPWAVINNQATGELGQEYDTFTDRLSVTLPKQGVVISAQGKLLDSAEAYYGEIAKKMSDSSTVALGYGSQYVGMNDRLSVTMNTSFTLGEMWQAVVTRSREDLKGGEQLQAFNAQMDDFFRAEGPPSAKIGELKRVFEQDVARKLIDQEIGTLRGEIDELRQAGAFLDNSRVRAMVGFVSSAVSEDLAERAVGGGFVVGTHTEMTLTKHQKALIDDKTETLYREGLRLQSRLIDLTKEWQGAVTEMAQAQWDLKLAEFMVQNAGSDALRQQGRVKSAEATGRLNQALLRYNALSGRSPSEPLPFDGLNAADLERLLAEIRKTVAAPDRLDQILGSLDADQMKAALGKDPLNLLKWIPWVDKMTVGMGVQLQDLMANQVFGLNLSVRLPIIDPKSKAADRAYVFERDAVIQEMEQVHAQRRLVAQKELEQARLWRVSADTARPNLPAAAEELSTAIREYRNGLTGPARLHRAFEAWHWYASAVLDAESRSALAEAWAAVDASFLKPLPSDGQTVRVTSLEDAVTLISQRSHGLAEVALRQAAAAEMAKANDRRIQKMFLDLNIGAGLTASGVGWLPSIGVAGIPVTLTLGFEFKTEELRELQVRQGQGESKYYDRLKTELEVGLALEFYRNIVVYRTAQGAVAEFDGRLLPSLRAEGDMRRFDEAKMRRDQAELAGRQAAATINYLLGRPGDAALEIDVDPRQALVSLKAILAAKDPVSNRKELLAARVDVARAVETMIDKDLRLVDQRYEPVSLTVGALARLIDALSSEGVADADRVLAARVQTLTEERAQEAFPKSVSAQISRSQTALRLARAELAKLRDRSDPESRLRWQALSGRELDLVGTLLSLGADPDAASSDLSYAATPLKFDDLRGRLRQSAEALSAQAPDAPVELLEPETLTHQAASFLRYYYAKQTLGREPIGKGFGEGWIEVRMRHVDTDPATLLKLAQLGEQRADRIHEASLASARARGDLLAADFEANVQMLRWAERETSSPGGAVKGSLDGFTRQMRQRLDGQRDEIVALLGLAPQTGVSQLIALVPAGARGLDELSGSFIAEFRRLQGQQLRETLFGGGLPSSFGREDDLIHQLRADTIAERMSYKGFTPVAAFGMFRDRYIAGGFLEAPDPRAIERGLSNVLSDALRQELHSTGRLNELTLRLHSMMSGVEDGLHGLERRRELVVAAEADYRAQMGRLRTADQLGEAEAARQRLLDAWSGLAEQMTAAKSDFIALVTELEALGQGRETPLKARLREPSRELPALRRDSRSQLLSFWADRMLDDEFRAQLGSKLDALGKRLTPDQRAAVARRADLFALADRDARVVRERDFSPEERLDLLTRNDREGKRQKLQAELESVLDATGGLALGNPLFEFLLADLDAEAGRSQDSRREYMRLSHVTRQGAWESIPAHNEARGAYERLEALRARVEGKRQSLLQSYLTDLGDNPNRFVLKDLQLDEFLKAQQALDAELIKTFESDLVRGDPTLAWRLDGFFDMRAALARQIDAARAGRGMLAIDALIMLEESRLLAARWQGRPPQEIDAVARALQDLRLKKQAWIEGAVDLAPLYALTSTSKDGRRLWTIDGWLTADEFQRELAAGRIKADGGRYYKDTPQGRQEVFGGVDALEAERDEARAEALRNRGLVGAQELMKAFDFVADRPDSGGRQGYQVEELFGRDGKAAQGRVFFFEAPGPGEPEGTLHDALHPLEAFKLSPDRYRIYVHLGEPPPARERYPTLESLDSSDEAKDFYRLTLSARGAAALIERAESQRAAELSAGWIGVKLNSYGFARDKSGGVAQLYLTQDDFNAQRKAFIRATEDLEAARRELERAQSRLAGLNAGAEELKHARAQATNARTAVTEAERLLADSKEWSLYESRDVALSLDRDGRVVAAVGQPVYGGLALNDAISGGPAAETMRGELLAAALDERGRVRAYYQDPRALSRDAASWTIRSVSLSDENEQPAGEASARLVRPTYRLSHYELEGPDGERVPVSLSRRFMIESAREAKSKAKRADHWGVNPWNLGNLMLEVPRGVLGAPIELMTGRDARQSHYLGRAYMYKMEGGTTRHYGLLRKAAGVVDVFNFGPDHVEPIFDQSQFPERVEIPSPVLPGQSVASKRMRTPDGELDVHFGAQSLRRRLAHSLEDITAARERTLAYFHGGSEEILIKTLRGRAGQAEESQVRGASGPQAVAGSLIDSMVAGAPGSDGSATVVIPGKPGNIAVDAVEKRVRIRVGSDALAEQARALKDYPEALAKLLERQRADQPGLDQKDVAAEAALSAGLGRRAAASEQAASIWDRLHALAWRQGAHEALEREIASSKLAAAALRERRSAPAPVDPVRSFPGDFWALIAALSALASAFLAAVHLARRRRRDLRPF